jgi:hypothetical protein
MDELARAGGLTRLRGLLSGRGRLALLAARLSQRMLLRTTWHLGTLEELVLRELGRSHGWKTE